MGPFAKRLRTPLLLLELALLLPLASPGEWHCGASKRHKEMTLLAFTFSSAENTEGYNQCCKEHDFCWQSSIFTRLQCDAVFCNCVHDLNVMRIYARKGCEWVLDLGRNHYYVRICPILSFPKVSGVTASEGCSLDNRSEPEQNLKKCLLKCEKGFFELNGKASLTLSCKKKYWSLRLEGKSETRHRGRNNAKNRQKSGKEDRKGWNGLFFRKEFLERKLRCVEQRDLETSRRVRQIVEFPLVEDNRFCCISCGRATYNRGLFHCIDGEWVLEKKNKIEWTESLRKKKNFKNNKILMNSKNSDGSAFKENFEKIKEENKDNSANSSQKNKSSETERKIMGIKELNSFASTLKRERGSKKCVYFTKECGLKENLDIDGCIGSFGRFIDRVRKNYNRNGKKYVVKNDTGPKIKIPKKGKGDTKINETEELGIGPVERDLQKTLHKNETLVVNINTTRSSKKTVNATGTGPENSGNETRTNQESKEKGNETRTKFNGKGNDRAQTEENGERKLPKIATIVQTVSSDCTKKDNNAKRGCLNSTKATKRKWVRSRVPCNETNREKKRKNIARASDYLKVEYKLESKNTVPGRSDPRYGRSIENIRRLKAIPELKNNTPKLVFQENNTVFGFSNGNNY